MTFLVSSIVSILILAAISLIIEKESLNTGEKLYLVFRRTILWSLFIIPPLYATAFFGIWMDADQSEVSCGRGGCHSGFAIIMSGFLLLWIFVLRPVGKFINEHKYDLYSEDTRKLKKALDARSKEFESLRKEAQRLGWSTDMLDRSITQTEKDKSQNSQNS